MSGCYTSAFHLDVWLLPHLRLSALMLLCFILRCLGATPEIRFDLWWHTTFALFRFVYTVDAWLLPLKFVLMYGGYPLCIIEMPVYR